MKNKNFVQGDLWVTNVMIREECLAVLNHPNLMLNFPTSLITYSKQYVVSYGEVSYELRGVQALN